MQEQTKPNHAAADHEALLRARQALALCRGKLHRAERLVAAYRRHFRPPPYGLKLYDRMLVKRFNPAFVFTGDLPVGRKVLIVLPHHHEAAKIGGLVRMLEARETDPRSKNRIHIVVAMPCHRSISASKEFRKREDMIDAVRKEGLDWAHLMGLDLGVAPWDPDRRLMDPRADLPPESAYPCRRVGDMFVYGPEGTYRFFNAWKTYDTGEKDPNQQHVDPEDQKAFHALLMEEHPDIVLLPDAMDPHPSHRNTRDLVMEGLRGLLAERDATGDRHVITLLEYASFHLVTPPRYNLWAVAPKEIARSKTLANKVFRLQKQHDYETDEILAERVVSMAAVDEYIFARQHPEKSCFDAHLSPHAPAELPANVTAEHYTVNTLGIVRRRGVPIVLETRVANPLQHLASMNRSA